MEENMSLKSLSGTSETQKSLQTAGDSAPFPLASSKTVRTYARKTGATDSPVAQAVYTINAPITSGKIIYTPAQIRDQQTNPNNPDYVYTTKWCPSSCMYGPIYKKSGLTLATYPRWEAIKSKAKINDSIIKIFKVISPNGGEFDAVQGWDDQAVTVGAMQKTVRQNDGQGELFEQIYDFSLSYPAKYKILFVDKGWYVNGSKTTGRLSYKDPEGKDATEYWGATMFDKVRTTETVDGKTVPSTFAIKMLNPLRHAGQDPDFQDQQVIDFGRRINDKALISITNLNPSPIVQKSLSSEKGVATWFDQSINRPGYFASDIGTSYLNSLSGNPTFDKTITNWTSAQRLTREPSVLQHYGVNRRMTNATERYNAILNATTLSGAPGSMVWP